MTTKDSLVDAQGAIRETYEVYGEGPRAVAMIADPRNGDAWIQSNRVQSVVP